MATDYKTVMVFSCLETGHTEIPPAFNELPDSLRILPVSTTQELREALSSRHIDVLFYDLQAPGAGLRHLETLCQDFPRLPIVAVSTDLEGDIETKCLQGGAQNFLLMESLSERVLLRTIRYSIDRKSFENAISASEEKYRNLFNSMVGAVALHGMIYDDDGKALDYRFLQVNKAFEELLGMPAEKIIGKTVLELLPNTESYWIESYGHVADTGEPASLANYASELDRYYEVQAYSPQRGQFVAVINEVTDRVKAQQDLERERLLLRTLIDALPDSIYVKDLESRFIMANTATAELMNAGSPDKLIDKSDADFYPPEYADKYRQDEKQVMDTGEPMIGYEEDAAPSNNPETRRLITTKIPLRDEHGAISGLVGVSHDVTELAEAREAIIESEKRYRTLVDEAPIPIIVHSRGNIAFINGEAVRTMGGKAREDFLGRSVMDFVHQDYHDLVKVRIAESRQRHDASKLEREKFIRLDGEVIDVEVVSTAINFEGELSAQVVFRDITDILNLEAEQLRSQKLESIGIMAGGIAHDFNNLLGAILGNISLAKYSLEDDSEIGMMLLQAEQACIKAKGLTQQLLTFSKGGKPLKKTVRLPRLLRDSAEFVLRGSKVKPEFKFAEKLTPISADEAQISQVINNLVINAEQAMPEGGSVTIAASTISVASDNELGLTSGRYAKIQVIDHGTGISPKLLPNIFDPYFSTKQKGSGLGLATSHSIIKNHNGQIKVSSVLGKGSAFTIYLPSSPDDCAPDLPSEKLTLGTHSGSALVMDDDSIVQNSLRTMLEKLGYDVIVTPNGEEAIQAYQARIEQGKPFDVVIMDLTVPGGMGGDIAIKHLLKIDPNASVIVASGYFDGNIISEYERQGFKAALSKPFTVEELASVLKKL